MLCFSHVLPPEGLCKTLLGPQIYNRAHHLKACSGLKINCSTPHAGSGDEEMNRPHERTVKEMKKSRGCAFWELTILCIENIVQSGQGRKCTVYFFLSLCCFSFFSSVFSKVFCSPSLATHHLLHYTFSPFKE